MNTSEIVKELYSLLGKVDDILAIEGIDDGIQYDLIFTEDIYFRVHDLCDMEHIDLKHYRRAKSLTIIIDDFRGEIVSSIKTLEERIAGGNI